MAAKAKLFQVLMLIDRDNYGFNEKTLPPLRALMELARPDDLDASFAGVTGYFVVSESSLDRIEKAIHAAEELRDSDDLFSTLGIGLNEGKLIANFDWLGRVKKSSMCPLGGAANEASRNARNPLGYLEQLKALKGREDHQKV